MSFIFAPQELPCYHSPDDLIRSEEHTSELQSLRHLVCRLLLEKKKNKKKKDAKTQVVAFLMNYNEIHPLVREKRFQIAELEKDLWTTVGKAERMTEFEKVDRRC